MDSDKSGQGSQAERLEQLGDLHRQGMLSDEEYVAAAAKATQAGSPTQAGSKASSPQGQTDHGAPKHPELMATTETLETQESSDSSRVVHAKDGPKPRRVRKHTVAAIVGVVGLAAIAGAFIIRSAANHRQPSLVGTWSFGQGESQYSFTFNDNGSWTAQMSDPLGYSNTGSGTWSCEGFGGRHCVVHWDDREPQDINDIVNISEDDVYTYEFWAPGLAGDAIQTGSYAMTRLDGTSSTAGAPHSAPPSDTGQNLVGTWYFDTGAGTILLTFSADGHVESEQWVSPQDSYAFYSNATWSCGPEGQCEIQNHGPAVDQPPDHVVWTPDLNAFRWCWADYSACYTMEQGVLGD